MSRTSIDKLTKAIFGAKFDAQYQKWKSEGNNRSETSFGELIGRNRSSISNYRNGKDLPEPEIIKKICDIFGVPEDHFDIENATNAELYEKSPDHIEGIGKKHVMFSELIGLDLDLIRALTNNVDFDQLFPLYTPIAHETIDPETGKKKYDREGAHPKSAHVEEVDKDLRFLQVERDGKRITLLRSDLAFLKEVQDKLIDYVKFLLFTRSEEMKRETQKFNDDLTKGGYDENGNIRPEFVREHDRFAKYFFIFLDEPKPEWSKIYEKKKRKATQEDIDKFFEGGSSQKIVTKDGTFFIQKDGE